MAKKSRTTSSNAAAAADPSTDAPTRRLDDRGPADATRPEEATVFNGQAREADDATAVLALPVQGLAGGDDDAKTTVLSVVPAAAEPSLPGPTRSEAPADPGDGPTMRVKMGPSASSVPEPVKAAPVASTPKFAPAPAKAQPKPQVPPRSTEDGPGPLGADVTMRWGDDVHHAHFYPVPALVTIGQNGEFALPPDVMDGKDSAVLVEPAGTTDFALRVDNPAMSGTIWLDSQAYDVSDVRAGRTPLKGPTIPLTKQTRALLHFGDFTFEVARATVPPPPAKGGFKKENLLLFLCFGIATALLVGPLAASLIAAPDRNKARMSLEDQVKEREAELIEVKIVEDKEPPKEEEKAEEKKPDVPLAPPEQKKTAAAEVKEIKAEEKKVQDTLKDLKGEERDEAKKNLVADKMAKETAKVDDALKALNAAPSSKLFAMQDDTGAAANPNAQKADVTADPTGELSKDLGGSAGPGKKPGIAGAGDATSKQVAEGLGKDKGIGSQKVDVEAHEKKQQVVRVGSSGGDAEGELPKAVIKGYIATKMGAIKACYQKGLQANPELSGKVKVAFLIQPDGKVLGARVDDSSMNNSSVEECILNNVKAWHFPPAKGGGSTKVTYPFQFSSTH